MKKRFALLVLCLFTLLTHEYRAQAVAGFGPNLLGISAKPAPVVPPVAGYVLWLDGTYASNDNTSWKDRSGNGYDAVIHNVDINNKFVLAPGAVNGKQCYHGTNGANYYFQIPSYPTSPAVTAYVVYQSSSGGSINFNTRNELFGVQYDYGWSLQFPYVSNSDYGTFGYFVDSSVNLIVGVEDSAPHVMSGVYPRPAGTYQTYRDGTAFGYVTHTALGTTSRIRYVGNWEGVLNYGFEGYICEVIEYQTALSALDDARVDNYLGTKWGISVDCGPTTCAAAGYNCGSFTDACGGFHNCSACPSPQSCTANVCGGCSGPTCVPVAGYSFWVDATYPGNTNATWLDITSPPHNATVPSGAAPVLTPAAINGNAAYLFTSGSSSRLQTVAFAGNAATTVFVAFQLTSTTPYAALIDTAYTSNYTLMYTSSYGAETWFVGADYLDTSANTSAHILAIRATSGTNNFISYLDGVPHAVTASAGSTSALARSIGWWASYNAVSITGYIGEIVEYPSVLSPTDFTTVNEYLGTKWGVSVP